MMLEYVKLILQHSGAVGVVLIFWYLHYRLQSKREDQLIAAVFDTIANNTAALTALKTYIEAKS